MTTVEQYDNLSALHAAIRDGAVASVRKIAKIANVNDLHYEHGFPLSHAVETGNKLAVKALLDAGANPNQEDLMRICIRDDFGPIAKLLIEAGSDLEGRPTWEKDDDYETSLIYAVRENRRTIVKLLLDAGADPNKHDGSDESALLVARMNKAKGLVRLLEAKVSPDESAWVEHRIGPAYAAMVERNNELLRAIVGGKLDVLKAMIDKDPRVLHTWLQPDADYPLVHALNFCHSVATNGNLTTYIDNRRARVTASLADLLATIDLFVDRGAPTDRGLFFPAIQKAGFLMKVSPERFIRIVSSARDVDAVSAMNRDTALSGACWTGETEVAKVLLDHGASLNVKNNRDQTPLSLAKAFAERTGDDRCYKLLIEAGGIRVDDL